MTCISSAGIDPTRRSFLQAMGTGMAAISGSALFSGSSSAQEDPSGYLVFTYDDGTVEDYELTFRVHQEYNVPGCVAASSGLIGSLNTYLDPDQLKEMSDAGWEVMSHAIKHRAIGEIPITADVEAGDTEISVDSNRHGRYPGDSLALFDADGEGTEATVVGRGGRGDDPYLELKEPIDVAIPAGPDSRVRYTDEFTHEILAESKAQLEEIIGTDQVTGFVYPYERHDGLAAEIVPEYYDTTPRAFTGNGLNPIHGSDPFSISRQYYEETEMDETDIAGFLDQIVSDPVFGILASHSQYDTLTEERIATTIEMAQERNIEIVTLQEALDIFGIVEAPKMGDTGTTTDTEINDTESNDTESDGAEINEGEDDTEPLGLFDRINSFFQSLIIFFRSLIP